MIGLFEAWRGNDTVYDFLLFLHPIKYKYYSTNVKKMSSITKNKYPPNCHTSQPNHKRYNIISKSQIVPNANIDRHQTMYKTCLIIAPLTPVPTLVPNTTTPDSVNTRVPAAMDTSLTPEMDMTLEWETWLTVLGK
jgi:hypothetical protein